MNEVKENFMAQASPFPKSYFTYNVRNNVEPHVCWSSLTGVDKKFTTFVNHLEPCVTSSAGIERIFPNFSFIKTKLRNRLDLERASFLYVYECKYENMNQIMLLWSLNKNHWSKSDKSRAV